MLSENIFEYNSFIEEDFEISQYHNNNLYIYSKNKPTLFVDPYGYWHIDLGKNGEKIIHQGKYHFNKLGQLVKHNGKVIGTKLSKGAKAALKFLKNKSSFFKTPLPFIIIDPCLQYKLNNNGKLPTTA